jgi:hypothetical protein
MSKGVLYGYGGEMLSVKTIAGRVSLAPSTIYKYLKMGYSITDAIELGKAQSNKAFKYRKKTNNRTSKTYPYKDNPSMTVEEICSLEGISTVPLYRRLKKGMTPEEAVIDIKNNIATKFPYLGGHYSKWQLERITGATRWYLDRNIDDNKEYTEEEITSIIDSYKQQYVCMYKGMSLYQYCVQMRYNYNVIYYSMKAYGWDAEKAISQYVLCGQASRFAHKYALGDVLLYHFLIKMNMEDRYVMDRIRKGRTEEEALIDAVFLNREQYKSRTIRHRLRVIYGEIQSLDDVDLIKKTCDLDEDDIKFLTSRAHRVEEIITQYRLFSVVSAAQASDNTHELQLLLSSMSMTIEDLNKLKEELLEGFVERTESGYSDEIKYIWRKEN